MDWMQEAKEYVSEENYERVVQLYEQVIESEPDVVSHYWHLGLAYLLQNNEEQAQTTWFFMMAQGTNDEVLQWTQQLTEVLEAEAQQQAIRQRLESSWLIRQHIREIDPNNINNILQLILHSIEIKSFTPDNLKEWEIINSVSRADVGQIDLDLLLKVLVETLNFPSLNVLEFLRKSLLIAKKTEQWLNEIISSSIKVADHLSQADFAAEILEICLEKDKKNLSILQYLCVFYDKSGNYIESFKASKKLFENCKEIADKILASYLMAEASIQAHGWINTDDYIEQYKSLMKTLIEEDNIIQGDAKFSLILAPQLLSYLQDSPRENNWFQHKIANIFQKSLTPYTPQKNKVIRSKISKPLRIGYIGHTFRVHSVGWLSRWLFQYHNKESFQIGVYFINQNSSSEFSKIWFKDKSSFYRELGTNPQEIAEKIQQDEIDILVDLDSVTFNGTCMVMAFNPAPIQVTWLGKDASGISSIDYFIADPYVLPDNAQDYYQEKIWRLPQTYIAVDGFETDVPTLRRDHLGIPANAVIYYTAQNGLKRHPDTIRLQLQVLKDVSNSYLLVKGRSDEAAIQQLFLQIAGEESINPDRLVFLPMDSNEYVHRANLQISDVILDTFPYNGATTSLEALWAGIPLVTKVGLQFAARNTYAFLMNVGVTEGISWTDEEYVEWGIRLGRDEQLRKQVAWKLRQSRQTSPLWNAKQFTHEMEHAYIQMWQSYLDKTLG